MIENELQKKEELSPKAHCLYHWTSQFDYLCDILENGIWPRYCVEEFDWLLGSDIHIEFPVACFSDIPLRAAEFHGSIYGPYAISFSKNQADVFDVNPIWYIQEGTSMTKHIQTSCKHTVRTTLETIPIELKPILPFLKSTIGTQPSRDFKDVDEVLSFEDELEWRFSPLSLINTWKLGYGRGSNSLKDVDHEKSNGLRIQLPRKIISEAFVVSNKEKQTLEARWPELIGRVTVRQL